MTDTKLSPDYFQALYRDNPDPWGLASSDYERRKYQATLDMLPPRRFAAGLEVGCAIGVLTRRLAERTDRLLAVDCEASALEQARNRCADVSNVMFERMVVPAAWPTERFDLIVVSELLYYLTPAEVRLVATKSSGSLLENGCLLLVHWTHKTDLPLGGDEAVELFLGSIAPGLTVTDQVKTADYRMDIISRGRHPEPRGT